MSDAPYTTDSNIWEIKPGLCVGDLLTASECEEAVRAVDMERDGIMAQIRRHEEGLDERSKGWRLKAQTAMTWKKRLRTAINLRAADLKMGQKAKAKRVGCQEWPAKEHGVDEALADWRPFIGVRPALLSLLYDIDMLPEQTVTRAGAIRLAGLCTVWKRGEEGRLLLADKWIAPVEPTGTMVLPGSAAAQDEMEFEPDHEGEGGTRWLPAEGVAQIYRAMRAAAPNLGGTHADPA